MKSCGVNQLRFTERAIAWFRRSVTALALMGVVVPTTGLSYAFYFVLPRNLPEITPHYGESAYGIQLGLSLRTEVSDDPTSIAAYMTLRNMGTDRILIGPYSLLFFDFAASSSTGKKALLVDAPSSRIPAGTDVFYKDDNSLAPGASTTVRANLSRLLVVPEAGRYFFLMSAKMTISTGTPPAKAVFQPIELISGSVEFDVPASMVYTNTGKHPSSAVALPLSAFYVDPSIGRSPESRAMLQKANETRSNDFRKHWPHLIDGAPVVSNGPATAVPPVDPPPQDTVTVGDREGSRWWLAGVAAICAAVIGFVLLRRR